MPTVVKICIFNFFFENYGELGFNFHFFSIKYSWAANVAFVVMHMMLKSRTMKLHMEDMPMESSWKRTMLEKLFQCPFKSRPITKENSTFICVQMTIFIKIQLKTVFCRSLCLFILVENQVMFCLIKCQELILFNSNYQKISLVSNVF